MPKQRETDAELLFPVNGVHLGTEYDRQPDRTTAFGLNVRSWDPLASRERGGSRPGLTKYISTRPGG